MDDAFKGGSFGSVIDQEIFLCPKCKYEVSKQDYFRGKYKEPEPRSKVVIVPTTEPSKLIPKSETAWFRKLDPFKKAEILAEESKEVSASGQLECTTTRNGKVMYKGYCSQCRKNRTSFSTACNHCKTPLS